MIDPESNGDYLINFYCIRFLWRLIFILWASKFLCYWISAMDSITIHQRKNQNPKNMERS